MINALYNVTMDYTLLVEEYLQHIYQLCLLSGRTWLISTQLALPSRLSPTVGLDLVGLHWPLTEGICSVIWVMYQDTCSPV